MNNKNTIIIIIKNTFSNFSTPYSLWIPACKPYNSDIGGRNMNVVHSEKHHFQSTKLQCLEPSCNWL